MIKNHEKLVSQQERNKNLVKIGKVWICKNQAYSVAVLNKSQKPRRRSIINSDYKILRKQNQNASHKDIMAMVYFNRIRETVRIQKVLKTTLPFQIF